MWAVRLHRITLELGLGLLAILAALVVLAPGLIIVNLLYNAGLYQLLIATVVVGVALFLFQARIRPSLRAAPQSQRPSASNLLRESPEPLRPSAPSAFRTWGGVPIPSLRVALLEPANDRREDLAGALCDLVQKRTAQSAALTWAFDEVAGNGFLLVREPESVGETLPSLDATLGVAAVEHGFHHLWSAEGPAGYEEPVAFATLVVARSLPGREAEIHTRAREIGERVAGLPAIAGVELLMSEEEGTEPPLVLWLAAGSNRSARRQVYLALEAAPALTALASRVRRFDLLACEAHALLQHPAAGSAISV